MKRWRGGDLARRRPRRGRLRRLSAPQGIARPYRSPRSRAAFEAIPPRRWALAALSTVVAYAALAWYDQIALAHLAPAPRLALRRRRSPSSPMRSAHNIGATVVSGGFVRYRAYSQGPVGGRGRRHRRLHLAHLHPRRAADRRRRPADRARAAATLVPRAGPGRARAIVVALLSGLALHARQPLHFRPLRVAGFRLVYPRPPIAARQLIVGPIELIGAAGIIYFALPAATNPGFVAVLGVFLASFSAALLSHAPGGLGVLELTFLKAMPERRRPTCWRRCWRSACSI